MRIEEVATLFKVSRQTMYEWIKKYNIRRYVDPKNKTIKYVKPADIRAARESSTFIPVDEDEE